MKKTILRLMALFLVLPLALSMATAQTIIKKGNPNNRSLPVLMVDPTSSTSAGKTGLTGAAIGTAVACTQSTSSGSTAVGATSLVLSNATGFPTSGSVYVPTQNALITYTGVSTNTLTGIPASGAGSITATIPTTTVVTTGTAGSFTIKWTINSGAAQGFPALGAGSIIETANGLYEYIPTAAESNTTSDVHFIFSATGAIDYEAVAVFQSYKVDDLGLALVPFQGSVSDGLSTTTVIDSNLTAASTTSLKGHMVVFTSGVDIGLTGVVQSCTSGANSQLTLISALPSAPASTDTFDLIPALSKKQVDFLVNGVSSSDSKVLLSATTHTGAIIPTVTAVTNAVVLPTGTGAGQINLSAGNVSANVTQIAGQTASAAAGVTFPASIGTSTFAVGQNVGTATSVTGSVGSVTGNVGGTISGLAADTTTLNAISANLLGTSDAAYGTGTTIGHDIKVSGTGGSGLTAAAVAQAVWQDAIAGDFTALNSIGLQVKTDLDTNIGSRSTYAGADTAGTTTLLGRIPGTVQPQTGDSFARLGAPNGASISADIQTRSTYAGTDTSGTTTLLTRLPGVVQPQTGDAYARLGATPPTAAQIATAVFTDLLSGSDFSGTGAVGAALKAFMLAAPSGWMASDTTTLNAITSNVFAHPVETGVTYAQLQEMIGAYLSGNANFNTNTYYAVGDTGNAHPRFSFTLVNGVRTVTITP